jgi:DNA-binding winged helix-turn-helix (wHTH) protein
LRVQFDRYSLDTARRELRAGSALISVQPQVFDVLVYLIENRDRVISKDDLIASVWNGRTVSESTLISRINSARRAIGDDGEHQRLIRTVARKGIRFVGTVQEIPPSAGVAPQLEAPGQPALRLAALDRSCIAVLPFASLSNDAEQEHFADGIT